ncbi:MAG: division/cell wall cluster transcriptional repressor MraZ [Arachnia sp.]
MLMGTYTPKLDDKGRLILPAKFRDVFDGGLVVARTQERALAIYTAEAFEELMTPVSSAPSTLKQIRDYQRMMAAGASFEVPDKQGRITIPPMLRTYAGLDRDVVVIGAFSHAEIWDATQWQKYSEQAEEGFSEMDEELLRPPG